MAASCLGWTVTRRAVTLATCAGLVLTLALVFAAAAEAKIIPVKVTKSVRVGGTGTLTIRASFPTTEREPVAVCVAKVQTDPNHFRQLGRPRVIRSETEKVTWTWPAGKKPGRYRLWVVCMTNPAFQDQIPRADITFVTMYRITK